MCDLLRTKANANDCSAGQILRYAGPFFGSESAAIWSRSKKGCDGARARIGRTMIPFLMLCADLVLRNGKIVTLDAAQPQVEAVAITAGKIVAVGSNAEMARQITSTTKVIDLNGHLAIFGFIEGHGHFMGLGESKMMLNLRDAKNWDQIVVDGCRGGEGSEAR